MRQGRDSGSDFAQTLSMAEKALWLLITAVSLILLQFPFPAWSDDDVTGNHAVAGGYQVNDNCGSLTIIQDTYVYQSPHPQTKTRNYYSARKFLGKRRWVSQVRNGFAQIQYGENRFVWVHESSFTPAEWHRVADQCSGPNVIAPDNRGVYPSRGTRTENSGDLSGLGSAADSSMLNGSLKKDYAKLKEFYETTKRKERFVLLNKRNGYKFRTYVIDMQQGKVVTSFDSLMGYAGIGCGTGQTRPGIFRLHSARGTGASRKKHWGNNYAYYVIQNIGGHSQRWGGRGCGVDVQRVAHSNKNMSGSASNGERYSAGCFVTSPQIFDQWTARLAGNALIYNVQ